MRSKARGSETRFDGAVIPLQILYAINKALSVTAVYSESVGTIFGAISLQPIASKLPRSGCSPALTS